MKMDQNIARGTADLAFRVSSDMWMALSKPTDGQYVNDVKPYKVSYQ
jgi:hypothetical protein